MVGVLLDNQLSLMVLTKRTKTWPNTKPASKEDAETRQERTDMTKRAGVDGRKSFFRRGSFLFPFGILLGALLGFNAFVGPQDLQKIHGQMSVFMNEYDINLPQLPEFDLSRLEAEWTRLLSNIPEFGKFSKDGREFQVGEAMKARGLTAQHPVVIIPGIVSTGLESWSTSPDYRAFFREKLWGAFNMLSQVTFNKEKWIAAMMLDPLTGLDPPGAKVRAAEGIDAASSFIQGFWIWSKVVENLAVVNYDTNNLYLAPYDWRLSYYNLEVRDGYFSRLKSTIEGLKKRQNKKVVIAAHSMGSTVLLYFFKWVESPLHGNGGIDWVENHIESYISIAGTHLGVAKAMSAFLSGEMKDTVQMNPAGAYVLERFFSRKERQRLFRSWAGSASMWLKGGNAVWGSALHAPDDACNNTHTHGELIAFRSLSPQSNGDTTRNMTAEEAGLWILQHTPTAFQKMLETNYSYGIERDEEQLSRNDLDHRKWTNPLEVRLPRAPSMKIYCVYGHGKETERSYWYVQGKDSEAADAVDTECTDPHSSECGVLSQHLGPPSLRESWIDSDYTNNSAFPKLLNGVKMGEGDGTVSLVSLGAMCVEGWKRPRWNPAGIKITTVELPHRPTVTMPRGGANTSDHVDILGSTGLNEVILKVATGVGHEVTDNYVSDIQRYAQRIQWD